MTNVAANHESREQTYPYTPHPPTSPASVYQTPVAEQRQVIASDFSPRITAPRMPSRGATTGVCSLLRSPTCRRSAALVLAVNPNLGLKPEAITCRHFATCCI